MGFEESCGGIGAESVDLVTEPDVFFAMLEWGKGCVLVRFIPIETARPPFCTLFSTDLFF